MTRFALSIPSVALALCLCACSFSDKDDSDEDSSSSGTSSSSLSSSSAALDSSRMEITYVDTLSIGDTLAVRIPDSIALDSSWNLYLGTYPAGSILKLSLQSSVLDSAAQFRVRAELQGSQLPIDTLPDGSYAEYMTAGNTSFEENSFVLLDSGYYYLEVTVSRQDNTQADSVADFQIYYSVDSAYYQFVGGEDSVQLPTSEYIQGCFRINEAEDSVVYFFHASEGNRLTLVSGGENFASMTLRDSQDSLLDSTTTMRLQLLPEDSTLWYLKLRTETPSWNTGNYAFFSLHLDSVALGLGEYFAAPDTLAAPGDTVDIDWSGSASSGWDVRHDHYLYLGELSAGDTVNLFYGMQGLSNVDKQAFLLDASGDIVDTLDEVLTLNWNYAEPNVFIPSVTGIYYLHYRGLGDEDTYWSDTSYTLHLRALIQIRGMLSVWDYSPASYTLSSGDTLFLDSLLSFVSIVPSDASRNYKVLLARSERTLLQDSIDIVYTSQGTTPTGNQVFSRWLLAPQGASGTAHLLIQSIADPNQVDTCNVFVTP